MDPLTARVDAVAGDYGRHGPRHLGPITCSRSANGHPARIERRRAIWRPRVFLFVLFGSLLDRAGAGNYFIKLAFAPLGHLRGGPAKAVVVSSAMIGVISGSSIANVVTTGTFIFLVATVAMLLFVAATQSYFLARNRLWETAAPLLVAFTLFRSGFWRDMVAEPYRTSRRRRSLNSRRTSRRVAISG